MPELPEVETVRRGLVSVLTGRRILAVELRRPNLRFPFPHDFAQRLEGKKIVRLDRRAKYLLAHLSSKDVLVIHLGMTGRFRVQRASKAATNVKSPFVYDAGRDTKHDHVLFKLSGDVSVSYNDARRFGFMLVVSEAEISQHPLFSGLGVEPLGTDLTAEHLATSARGRRADLKAFLMDQRFVAGLGNIYACESLFRAGLSPVRQASTLARQNGRPARRTEVLVSVIRNVLGEAITAGGSTLRDYRRADGRRGTYQASFQVYGRDGEPCLRPRCRGVVTRRTQAGRSTFSCPVCQK
jgi:formamidopyrimidine-DNA glycosylase